MYEKQKERFKTLNTSDRRDVLIDVLNAEIEFLETDDEDQSAFADEYRTLRDRVEASDDADELYNIAISHNDIMEGLPIE